MPATLTTAIERVRLRMLIEARGTDADGHDFQEAGCTVEIHREGALVELPATAGRIVPGQTLAVRRQQGEEGWLEASARVLGLVSAGKDSRTYSLEMVEGAAQFWTIEFPESARSRQAVACMLL